MAEPSSIRTVRRQECLLCGETGSEVFRRFSDRIYHVPGDWSLLECSACRLFWLDPQTVPEDLHLLYRDYYTHEESEAEPRPPSLRERVGAAVTAAGFGYELPAATGLERVAAAAVVRPLRDSAGMGVMGLRAGERGKLLEIGCGSGAFLERMQRLGWAVMGFEPDPVAAEIARTKRRLDVREGQLESAGFAASSFDAVTLHHVIEHLPDPIATLEYCRTLLRPGGILSIATPNTGSLGVRLFGRSWLHWDPPRHLFVFSARSLGEVVRKAGFSVESVTAPTRGARWAFSASWRIRRRGSFPDASATKLGLPEKLAGAAFQMLEASLPGRARLGEELLLIGRRRGGPPAAHSIGKKDT